MRELPATSLDLGCFRAGVYFWIRNGEVLYIGKTSNLAKRIAAHHVIPSSFSGEDEIRVIFEPDATKRTILEYDLIALHKPKYNIETQRARFTAITQAYVERTGDRRTFNFSTVRERKRDGMIT